jgi:hypothetical protein
MNQLTCYVMLCYTTLHWQVHHHERHGGGAVCSPLQRARHSGGRGAVPALCVGKRAGESARQVGEELPRDCRPFEGITHSLTHSLTPCSTEFDVSLLYYRCLATMACDRIAKKLQPI